ncbi:alpha/beta hydrolase [Nocardia sp. 2]|uniref:Alpha/beta hydrolase n=1 Tax=Nocardia acididurans TaxID=2802282 RepID=A0ABS1M8Z8_9NOCA|nr:alpha/beta hydrolase [Nocardia acididurans]MBL1076515.1 alpha/beta hydrolase [Nocardia acididurans]
MFDGFSEFDIQVSGTTIHGRRGGSGPPLLLLHGIPETHLMWHRVAPELARSHTVVATDLRGFGASGKPASTPDHLPYAMSTLATDQVEVMAELGYPRFAVAGHDRGARCAYRMALDHPDVVTALAVLDIVPTGDVFDVGDHDLWLAYWVWTFLAAPRPIPETLIARSPSTFVNHMLDSWSTDPAVFPDPLRTAYITNFATPQGIRAICEEYRAAATVDYAADLRDRGVRRIHCPVLALWDEKGAVAEWFDPLRVWGRWAADLRGKPLRGGHFLPEENPGEVVRELLDFLAYSRASGNSTDPHRR